MRFDEQLERAFDNLTDRLGHEVAHQLRVVSDELATTWRAERAASDAAAAVDEIALTERVAGGVHSIGAALSLSGVLEALLAAAAREATRVGVLLVRGDRLRGWRFLGFGPTFDRAEAIEFPQADAGVIAQAARTGAAVLAASSDRAAVPAFADLPPGHDCAAVPLAMGGQVVAVLYADHEVSSLHALDVLASHAARCLESRTAIQVARALTEPPVAEAYEPSSSEEAAAARRYARLLVSEIKLYHEPQVVAGRRERDLATRLGVQIARARVFYEQRVPIGARRDTDYFDAELVRTLADGDASLLEVRT